MQRILDAMTGAPAFVRNGRLDVLAPNTLGRALYAPMYDDPARPVNMARFLFLGRRATEFWIDWGDCSKTTSRSSGPKPVATPTTKICLTSSASSPLAPMSSARCGPRTTSDCTAPGSSACTTQS